MGHGLMESRHGLLVDVYLTEASGYAEWVAALTMIEPFAERTQAITLGADKAYDTKDFVQDLRSMKVTPHVAQNINGRRSAIDGRTTRHSGYGVSLRIRKRIEEAFGWIKTVAGQVKTKFRGRDRAGWAFTFAAAAYCAAAETVGGFVLSAAPNCRLIGRWRIVEADLWDRCDASEPRSWLQHVHGLLQMARGSDEMDEVSGGGHAELLDDGAIEITFAYDSGDEAVLKAKSETSSTAC